MLSANVPSRTVSNRPAAYNKHNVDLFVNFGVNQ